MTRKLLLVAIAIATVSAVSYWVIAARRRDVADRFVRAVLDSDEIRIDWIGTPQSIGKPIGIEDLKRELTTQSLHPEWNYKKRLVHASFFLRRDGNETAALHYWGDGLISFDGQLFRLDKDPFPRYRAAIVSPTSDGSQ